MHNTPWMQTFSGRQSWPLNIKPEGLCIIDAAHSLAMQCRYAGHCINFYSVAEHSVHMFRHISKANRKAALLHDLTEYLLVDVPRAVKPELAEYKPLEHTLAEKIAKRFNVEYPWPEEVILFDNRILLDERAQNMTRFLREDEYYLLDDPDFREKQLTTPAGYERRVEEESGWPFHLEPLGIKLEFWPPPRAENEFLAAYAECKDD